MVTHIQRPRMMPRTHNVYGLLSVLQYHRGRLVPTRWVFGMVFTQFDPPRPVFYVVKNRARQTLEPLIVRHCQPGATIWSDEWRAYDNLGQLGFQHQTVNHSRCFVNPNTGIQCSELTSTNAS